MLVSHIESHGAHSVKAGDGAEMQICFPSEKSWLETTCHAGCVLTVGSRARTSRGGGVGWDVAAQFHVCQNAQCKIKYPIKHTFKGCISVQPTH